MIFKLFKLELKKYLKFLPLAIIGGIIPLAIIGCICFYGANNLYEDEPLAIARVAFVAKDINEEYVDFALSYLSNVESTSMALEFVEMSADKALEALEEREVIAVINFSNEQLNGLLYGNNIPVDITFNDDGDITSVILTELTKAGASFLSSAQASTYSISALYYDLEASQYLSAAYNDIDMINFSYVLSRNSCFEDTNGDFGGTSNLLSYYIGNGFMIYVLLLGCGFAPCFASKEQAFFSLLKVHHKPTWITSLLNFICYYICLVMYVSLLFFALCKADSLYLKDSLGLTFSMMSFMTILLISLLAASYTTFMYSLSSKTHYCVLLQFIVTFIICFVSGGFLPRAFMPTSINSFSNITGCSLVQSLFTCFATAKPFDKSIIIMTASILLLAISCLITSYKHSIGDNKA